MLPAPRVAFLSLSKAKDVAHHQAINAWHQLDHRPENLALEGVAHGERFVQTPELARTAAAAGDFTDFHYANLYWFDEPVPAAVDVWAEFAEQSFREGRRPDIDLLDRAYMDFFQVVGTAVSPTLRLNERALRFRPATGVIMIATEIGGAISRSALHERSAWELDVLLPALAEVPGISAAWALHSAPELAPAAWQAREAAQGTGNERIMRVIWATTEIDPPAVVLQRLRDHDPAIALSAPTKQPGATRFVGALETITPWQWDWFAGEGR
ncbi:hypothetical protein NODU109028_18610 [Nocardioides dubius]|uniref:Uncharacterized protein n=1 Tax=Nocardioides dubius TaxID=317019 RepID=A0ABN1TK69_9ACTN